MHDDDAIPSNQPALRNVARSAGIPPFLLASHSFSKTA